MSSSSSSARLLLVPPIILDGGMGHTLRRMGVTVSGEVGSSQRFSKVALANLQQPELVIQAHQSFLEAGADVITVNNYGIVPETIAASSKDTTTTATSFQELLSAAVDCAVKARERHGREGVKIAASISPLHASYRPDQVADYDENVQVYTDLVQNLRKHDRVDLFLCETMSTVDEARAAAAAVLEHGGGLPLWVSWTLRPDGRLRSGETVTDAVRAVVSLRDAKKALGACLLNCCMVEAVDKALDDLIKAVPKGCAVGAYPNSFAEQRLRVGSSSDATRTEANASDEYRDDLSPAAFSTVTKGWLDKGCTIVGGCCGIFPEHILELTSTVK